ncbi:MAG: DUF3105 domain-containing protein [Propionibacteriales bacterium]|nr:DUF3105 domain-containing protein [Propionibacteriales bacterium]
MSKSNKNRERREMVEQMRKQAKAAERRRTIVVISICVVVALIIVGAAGFSIYQDKKHQDELKNQALGDLGASATSAGCNQVVQNAATGAGKHTPSPVLYATVPPSYGPHDSTADSSGTHFYTADDRPTLEVLVHNLEHGWTIVWYDDTTASDKAKLQTLKDTATKFDQHGADPQYNMIIAPWTKDDGDGQVIPDGKHIAFTHWSIHHPTYDATVFQTAEAEVPSWGESQYCSTFSGGALDAFMKQFPYDDAPEGSLWHQ